MSSTAWQPVVDRWRSSSSLARDFVDARELPGRSAQWADFPADVEPRLVAGLARGGLTRLYSHQRQAWDAARDGHDFVVTTPTASGKSLCYNLPVLDTLLREPSARALYLFPTKALARDQVGALRELVTACGAADLGVAVFDGDTPGDQRRRARDARILVTNPDMLHTGLLPHHASWAALFAGLRFVVVDELHACRGLFGAGVANVLRRLRRVAAFHGARPRFMAASATVGNPGELATAVLGSAPPALEVLTESGAPSGPRTFLVYNPPVIDSALGLRASYLKAAERITRDLLDGGVSTLVFTRSRRAVEILVRYLHDHTGDEERIRGYRGGYLPGRRREVERLLKSGEAQVVVSTSALELGVDIGGLDAVVIAGWPGSRAAAWQRAGRAGRRGLPSLVVLVACSEPLDQYVANDPEYLFGASPEHARLDADNLAVLVPHIKCAAFELPFTDGEAYGALGADETREVLRYLGGHGLLHEAGGRFHWIADAYPAQGVPLRGISDENFAVIDVRDGAVLAEVDHRDAARQLHPNAIYPLEGHLHQVERLDWPAHKAYVRPVDVDYTTDALTHTRVRLLEALASDGAAGFGDVHVVDAVVGFKKIKLHTHENVGYGEVSLPPFELHTRALWLDPAAPPLASHLAAGRAPWVDAVARAAYALKHIAALLVLCDSGDLGTAIGDPASPGHLPRIYIYDIFPGGAGLCERLYDARADLLERAARLVRGCLCQRGCPGCVGPLAASAVALVPSPKEAAWQLLTGLAACSERSAA
jgi:DEAD/DEAH box helicase domain-containing protein